MKSIGKLFLNSLWGKVFILHVINNCFQFGQRPNKMQKKFFTKEEFHQCVFNPSNIVSTVDFPVYNVAMVSYNRENDFIDTVTNVNIAIAAAVTC